MLSEQESGNSMLSIGSHSFGLVFNKVIAMGYVYKIPRLVQNDFNLKGSFPRLESLYLRSFSQSRYSLSWKIFLLYRQEHK